MCSPCAVIVISKDDGHWSNLIETQETIIISKCPVAMWFDCKLTSVYSVIAEL